MMMYLMLKDGDWISIEVNIKLLKLLECVIHIQYINVLSVMLSFDQ